MTGVIMAAVVVGLIGLLIGLLLGFAAKAFAVPVDEKEIEVREFLPGNNCGGCGYAGCDALAKAIAAGEAPVNACPVGGAAVAEKIGNVMGVAAGDSVKMVAYVKCSGTCDKAGIKANYYGISDCKRAAAIPGRVTSVTSAPEVSMTMARNSSRLTVRSGSKYQFYPIFAPVKIPCSARYCAAAAVDASVSA